MTSWLFPANEKFYDVSGAMAEKITYWPMNGKVSEGDTIYFYLAAPSKRIAWIGEVIEIELTHKAVFNKVKPFLKGDGAGDKQDKPFFSFKPHTKLEDSKNNPLSLAYLKENGLNGMLMGPRKLENNPKLLEYIKGFCNALR